MYNIPAWFLIFVILGVSINFLIVVKILILDNKISKIDNKINQEIKRIKK